LEKLYVQGQKVQDVIEEKFDAIECETGNVEVQWNNIKKFELDTVSDLVGKVERRARRATKTKEMIGKIGKRRKWKNYNNEERMKKERKKYGRLRNES
jgi:hypothetical protein